jgi:hypothetical protein
VISDSEIIAAVFHMVFHMELPKIHVENCGYFSG